MNSKDLEEAASSNRNAASKKSEKAKKLGQTGERSHKAKAPSAPSPQQKTQQSQAWSFLVPRSSYTWAVLFCLLFGAWFLTGDVIIGGQSPAEVKTAAVPPAQQVISKPSPAKFEVRTTRYKAQQRKAELTLRGRTEADAQVFIKARTAGMVTLIHKEKGGHVRKDTLLCRLDPGARAADLKQAQANEAQARQKFFSSKNLHTKGHVSKTKLLIDKAQYDAAKAISEKTRLDLKYTNITAPFSGIVEDQPARIGDFLAVGSICALLVKLDPLIVRIDVSETQIGKVRRGQKARAALVTGEKVSGKIRYISSMADPKTRTFKVELAVKNPHNRLRDGVTASAFIPLAQTSGHFLPASLLVLDHLGRVGVRIVDARNIVRFVPVDIKATPKDGVWVEGLPKEVDVVSVGQDYVKDGQNIDVHKETSGKIAVRKRGKK